MPVYINCDTLDYQQWDSYTLGLQRRIPLCGTPPAACEVEITNIAKTAVGIRGGSDGTITATVTGNTGTTLTWYLNGVSDGTGNTPHTFTGLTSEYYNVYVEEGICSDQETDIFVVDGSFRTGDFITTEPSDLVAANNPIPFTIRTATNVGNPTPSKATLSIIDTVSDGDTITFSLEYPQVIEVSLTARDYPDRDEYFLTTTTTTAASVPVTDNTMAEIAQSLGAAIEKNTELSRLYSVYVNDVDIFLTAKENNQKLDLVYNTSVFLVFSADQSIDIESTQAGKANYDGALTENYSVYADVFVQPSVSYGTIPTIQSMTKVATLELPFQQNNIHRMNLAPVLQNYVSTPVLDWNLSGFTTVAPALAAFRVQFGERYPLIPNTNTKKSRFKGVSDVHYVLNSSLDWEDSNDMQEYLGNDLHNLKADFSGNIVVNTSTEVSIEIDDYLIDDTDTTTTTDIKFRFTGTEPVFDSGWQTGNTYTATGITDWQFGDISISGISSGIYVENKKEYWAVPEFDVGEIETYNYNATIKHEVKFLTGVPQIKTMQRDGSDWLFIMLPKDYGRSLKVKADLYFYNGDSLTGQTLYNVFTGTSNAGGVFMFGSGYEQLGLAAYETSGTTSRKIRRVDFALYQNDAANGDYLFSEIRSYRYEIDQQPSTLEIAFQQKLGFYDTFSFIGEIVDNVERTTGKYEVPLNVNSDGSLPRGFQKNTVYNTRTQKTIRCNSGWLDQDHRNWLVDNLLSSNRIYQITQDNENYVTIESVQESSSSSNNTLFQLNVTLKLTTYENNVGV